MSPGQVSFLTRLMSEVGTHARIRGALMGNVGVRAQKIVVIQ